MRCRCTENGIKLETLNQAVLEGRFDNIHIGLMRRMTKCKHRGPSSAPAQKSKYTEASKVLTCYELYCLKMIGTRSAMLRAFAMMYKYAIETAFKGTI